MDDRNLYGTAVGLDMRGRYKTTASAFEAAYRELLTEKNEFYDSLCDNWKQLFPNLPARPGRYEDGYIFIYVRNAPLSYAIRPKLKAISAKLAELPGAPKKINLRLEIHAT